MRVRPVGQPHDMPPETGQPCPRRPVIHLAGHAYTIADSFVRPGMRREDYGSIPCSGPLRPNS